VGLIGASVVVLAGPAHASSSSTTVRSARTRHAPKLDAATKAKLKQIVESQFAKSGMPGVAVLVSIGDRRWETTLGVSDLETNEPFALDDHVRIASITKTFAATAILQLVDNGKLSLDDTLDSFVPGIPNGENVTVRDLLAMSSGIYDFTSDQAFLDAFAANPNMAWTPEQSVNIMKQHPSQFEPGTKTVYCDSNYVLLGLILEKVTGKDAAKVIDQRVVKKAGLPETSFPTTPGLTDPHATGYLPDPDDPSKPLTVVGDINPQVGWTAGAMNSTLDDLQKWSKTLADGSLLSPELQRQRLKSNRFEGVKINAGYGLGVERINDLVGHNGAILGFSTAMYRYPHADATFVVVGNASTNFTTPTTDIALHLIQELYPKQVR
jgi:D-alanyl-D-alanine carboxypeptidase